MTSNLQSSGFQPRLQSLCRRPVKAPAQPLPLACTDSRSRLDACLLGNERAAKRQKVFLYIGTPVACPRSMPPSWLRRTLLAARHAGLLSSAFPVFADAPGRCFRSTAVSHCLCLTATQASSRPGTTTSDGRPSATRGAMLPRCDASQVRPAAAAVHASTLQHGAPKGPKPGHEWHSCSLLPARGNSGCINALPDKHSRQTPSQTDRPGPTHQAGGLHLVLLQFFQ